MPVGRDLVSARDLILDIREACHVAHMRTVWF